MTSRQPSPMRAVGAIDMREGPGHTRPSRMITRYSEARLPTPHGEFRVVVYRTGERGGADATAIGLAHEEHVAMVLGDVTGGAVLTRVHSSCFTGEVL